MDIYGSCLYWQLHFHQFTRSLVTSTHTFQQTSHLILVAPNVLDPVSIAILPLDETVKQVNELNKVAKGLGFICDSYLNLNP